MDQWKFKGNAQLFVFFLYVGYEKWDNTWITGLKTVLYPVVVTTAS
jgi:hypothetical protein